MATLAASPGSVLVADMLIRSLPEFVPTLTIPISAGASLAVAVANSALTASAKDWLFLMAATSVAMERSLS